MSKRLLSVAETEEIVQAMGDEYGFVGKFFILRKKVKSQYSDNKVLRFVIYRTRPVTRGWWVFKWNSQEIDDWTMAQTLEELVGEFETYLAQFNTRTALAEKIRHKHANRAMDQALSSP